MHANNSETDQKGRHPRVEMHACGVLDETDPTHITTSYIGKISGLIALIFHLGQFDNNEF